MWSFSAEEAARLRHYLESGGFLHADDNYGMDESFRRAMRQVFPNCRVGGTAARASPVPLPL